MKRQKPLTKKQKMLIHPERIGTSDYALKRAWLNRHGMWGWEVPEPKPWRRKR